MVLLSLFSYSFSWHFCDYSDNSSADGISWWAIAHFPRRKIAKHKAGSDTQQLCCSGGPAGSAAPGRAAQSRPALPAGQPWPCQRFGITMVPQPLSPAVRALLSGSVPRRFIEACRSSQLGWEGGSWHTKPAPWQDSQCAARSSPGEPPRFLGTAAGCQSLPPGLSSCWGQSREPALAERAGNTGKKELPCPDSAVNLWLSW